MNQSKIQVAQHIVDLLPKSGIIALGSGTTVNLVIEYLAQKTHHLQFLSASSGTSRKLFEYNQTELSLQSGIKRGIDFCVDGADEVYAHKKYLIKGHGGALHREKIIWSASRHIYTCIVSSKISKNVTKSIPVEITPFSYPVVLAQLEQVCQKVQQKADQRTGMPVITDNGNYIVHLQIQPGTDLLQLHKQVKSLSGVVDTGIFGPELMQKNTILVGYEDHVEEF